MKQLLTYIFFIIFINGFAQKKQVKGGLNQKVSEKYASVQPQDFSVPPPPINEFPAQFPEGNKKFVEKVISNLDKRILKDQPTKLNTEIILKIDEKGKILNISAFGNNDIFNNEVVKTAKIISENIIWTPAQNKKGEKVIDILRLPIRYNSR